LGENYVQEKLLDPRIKEEKSRGFDGGKKGQKQFDGEKNRWSCQQRANKTSELKGCNTLQKANQDGRSRIISDEVLTQRKKVDNTGNRGTTELSSDFLQTSL